MVILTFRKSFELMYTIVVYYIWLGLFCKMQKWDCDLDIGQCVSLKFKTSTWDFCFSRIFTYFGKHVITNEVNILDTKIYMSKRFGNTA